MTEKYSWDQANIPQKLGLVWRNRKKISQIIKDYFYLPFFILIFLWGEIYPNGKSVWPPMQMLQQFWVQFPSTVESEGR